MYFGITKESKEWAFGMNEAVFDKSKEVSDEEYNNIRTKAKEECKRIIGDKEGNPVLDDYPEPTPEELKQEQIKELERFLSSTDWYAIRFADTGEPMPSDIKQQRQEAREEISRLRE